MGGVDHDMPGLRTLSDQTGEDTVEDAEAAPSDEAIVEGLV